MKIMIKKILTFITDIDFETSTVDIETLTTNIFKRLIFFFSFILILTKLK